MEYNTKEYIEALKSKYRTSGISSLTELEILEVLLAYGKTEYSIIREVAQRLLKRFYTLYCIFERSPQILMETEGMNMQSAIILNMQSALFRIYKNKKAHQNNKPLIGNGKNEYIRSLFIGRSTELFYAVMLTDENKIIAPCLLSAGTINRTNVYTRRLIELALHYNAKKVLFAHNHPNGISLPSTEDIQITFNLYDALASIDVSFDDHIILTESKMVSLVNDMHIFEHRHTDYEARLIVK